MATRAERRTTWKSFMFVIVSLRMRVFDGRRVGYSGVAE